MSAIFYLVVIEKVGKGSSCCLRQRLTMPTALPVFFCVHTRIA